MANVLVMGATRGIGLEVVKQGLAAGHSVRAMARSAAAIPIQDPKLEKFTGDALDAEAVKQALDGTDVVIQALGVAAGPDLVLRRVTLFSRATRVLVSAMKDADVKRLLCVTGFGAGDSRNRGNPLYNVAFNLFLGRAYDDKDVQEQIIRKSGLDWVIARPGILTNGPRSGAWTALTEPHQWRCGVISRADVADFLVKQIDADDFLGETPVLIG